ncbi:glycosyltransferase [Flavobacterium restrictum]|uniref:Glycosyltransferase n=1 Tax=Flavobacterium restrictum TaxID=2594428 RepID=A0A553E511_9FLAO|nr:glycosyltransferase [Flavobacterium restrictum]TRX40136.1 glycosyltransferase [Flavobacterium restrictum]
MYTILFNFSSSYSGGGLKRLEEFSKWFSINGGATFLINERSKSIVAKYPNNVYHIPRISKLSRILNSEKYFETFSLKQQQFDLYYSYGIPITKKIARINLLHISNVLPFVKVEFGYTFWERLKFKLLRFYFIKSFSKTDVLCAESNFSISLVHNYYNGKTLVSKNGSDEEMSLFLAKKTPIVYENYAVVLGTHKHKFVDNSYLLFKEIAQENQNLKLKIIGDASVISQSIKADKNVEILGVLNREVIMSLLSKAKYYISTTVLENSYNAASEAIFLAEESYISTIKPHEELLENLPYSISNFNSIAKDMIVVKASEIDIRNLVSWEQVILEILNTNNDVAK